VGAVGKVFLALDPPEETRHHLAASLTEAFAGFPVPGRRVEPGGWHLTLRFLGDVRGAPLDRLLAELDETDLGDPFEVALDGLGAFPRPERAQVLWVGLADGEGPLADLRRVVEDACDDAGLGREGRPFIPHVTISRLRPSEDVWPWLERDPHLRTGWPVEAVTLFRSHPGGAMRYERLEAFPLG